jgi:hypothetical protein
VTGSIAGAVVGLCCYVSVGLAAPGLHSLRHFAAALALVVAIVTAAKYA